MLCKLCTGALLETGCDYSDERRNDFGNGPAIYHHDTYFALEQSAAAGCDLCSFIHSAISNERRLEKDKFHRYDAEGGSRFILSFGQANDATRQGADGDIGLEANLIPRSDFDGHDIMFYRSRRDKEADEANVLMREPEDVFWFRIEVLSGKVGNLSGRSVPKEPDLPLYQSWIEECVQTHRKCTPPDTTELPTRVIDIGLDDTSQPKLAQTLGRTGRYVALSHCWGTDTGSRPPVTTLANFDRHLQGIDLRTTSGLAQTFVDAIKVTRALGVRFLWIDALCIIQDDPGDWQRECARMSGVYSQAVVTIAGPNTPDSYSGFLHNRSPWPNLGDSTTFDVYDFSGCLAGHLKLTQVHFQLDFRVGGPDHDPRVLMQRGWVTQERMLSHRPLYFGPSQAYLECNTCSRYEDLQHSSRPSPVEPNASKNVLSPGRSKAMLFHNWLCLIGEHSGLKLSNPNDVLPSLSGLAQNVHAMTGGLYCAGLWVYNISRGLAWKGLSGRRSTTDPHYSGPSWSWTSCPGRISYHPIYADNEEDCRGWTSGLHVLKYQGQPLGADPFGQVNAAQLVLQGQIREAKANGPLASWIWTSQNRPIAHISHDYHYKHGAETRHAEMLSCLLLYYGEYCWAGLALGTEISDDDIPAYRRLGLLEARWHERCIKWDHKDVLGELHSTISDREWKERSKEIKEWFKDVEVRTLRLV